MRGGCRQNLTAYVETSQANDFPGLRRSADILSAAACEKFARSKLTVVFNFRSCCGQECSRSAASARFDCPVRKRKVLRRGWLSGQNREALTG